MRISFTIIFLVLFKLTYSQHCNCDENPEIKEVITCKPIHFKNKTEIFWQYDCDSSWLSFKNSKGKKTVLYTLEAGLMELTEKLGYSYAAEYKSSFLIKNNLISGCCVPSEFILFNKTTGKKQSVLGRLIFYSEDSKHPVVVYFESNGENKNLFNNIILKNIDKNKSYKIKLHMGRIWSTLQSNGEMFAEHLMDGTEINDNKLKITYRFKLKDRDEWQSETIVIDLSKYGS